MKEKNTSVSLVSLLVVLTVVFAPSLPLDEPWNFIIPLVIVVPCVVYLVLYLAKEMRDRT